MCEDLSKRSVLLLAVVVIGLAKEPGHAQQRPGEALVSIPTVDLTDDQFLKGDRADARPLTLTGRLQWPAGNLPSPAVILLGGSDRSGNASAWSWAEYLNGVGVATLRLDS